MVDFNTFDLLQQQIKQVEAETKKLRRDLAHHQNEVEKINEKLLNITSTAEELKEFQLQLDGSSTNLAESEQPLELTRNVPTKRSPAVIDMMEDDMDEVSDCKVIQCQLARILIML
jgi:cell division septum initiation protein DivIVA